MSHEFFRNNKIVVRHLPKDIDWSDFEKCLKEIGDVLHCDHGRLGVKCKPYV